MQYMILIYGDEARYAQMAETDAAQKMYAEFIQYSQDLAAAGVIRGGAELKPVATATTVRVIDGRTTLVDGPFAETKEQLGGYYLIDVPSLDDALHWAARCPGAKWGGVEVRPLGVTPEMGA